MASLLMAGCSKEDVSLNDKDDGNGGTRTSYLSVKLISSDEGTRASGGYEDGTLTENKITKVRFYFFTANGAASPVKLSSSNGYVNYYDWTATGQTQGPANDTDDIESTISATIVINTSQGDKLPQSIAAVMNPDNVELGDDSMSLSELKAIEKDFTKWTSENFVMFNSVYGEGGSSTAKVKVSAVPITADNLQKSEDDAKDHPVILHVERSVAKVTVTYNNAPLNNTLIELKDKNDNLLTVNGEQVYLRLEGWDLTATTQTGRLVKEIDLGWTTSWWNGSHRSFWALNAKSANNNYFDYNSIGDLTGAKYTNENAAKYIGEDGVTKAPYATKVIIKGTLCKDDGSAFTIVRHLGAHFADTYSETPSENLPQLKTNILAQLSNNGHKYYFEKDDGSREQIGTNDLIIEPLTQISDEALDNNCYVHAQLTEAAKTKKWYTSLATDAQELADAAATINGALANTEIVDRALVWKNGMTYYFLEIIHNKPTDGTVTYGVVRNHVYKTNITKIAGLGTPVYKPEEKIYPEKPDPNEHFIAAQINILSWRIVTNDYKLEW